MKLLPDFTVRDGTMNRMAGKVWIGALLAAAMGGAACSHHAAPPPPPPLVVVAPAQTRNVDLSGEWVATLDGYLNANIQPEVSGYLISQDYVEGARVSKGQVLFHIDPRPFQAALDQARGAVTQAQSQVAQAEAQVGVQQAQLGTAQLNVQRDVPEAAAQAIPQSQLQTDQQAERAAEAQVTAAQATVKAEQAAVAAAQAQMEQAQLNLGFTEVRSLLDGVAGITQTQIGNLVSPQTVLTVVSQLDPIKAYFPISAQDYLRSTSHAPGTVDLLSSAHPAALTLELNDGTRYPYRGHVLFADRQVDPSTGTLRVAASFPNPGGRLRPGETARVSAVTEHVQGAVLVPQAAVSQLQNEYEVAVVTPNQHVQMRPIQVGATVGTDWIVTQGLQAGELVIVEGQGKVRDGMPVRIQTQNAAPAPASGEGR